MIRTNAGAVVLAVEAVALAVAVMGARAASRASRGGGKR